METHTNGVIVATAEQVRANNRCTTDRLIMVLQCATFLVPPAVVGIPDLTEGGGGGERGRRTAQGAKQSIINHVITFSSKAGMQQGIDRA